MDERSSPLGRVVGTDGQTRLEFRRDHSVPVEDLWSAVTEPDRLARWVGTWSGEPRVGGTVKFQLLHEPEPMEPEDVTIVACDPPRLLAVDFPSPDGPWRIELELSATETGSSLLFVQSLFGADQAADAGPGWHWYLDRLAHALGEAPRAPGWDEFYTPEVRAAYGRPTLS
ncbi:SRPBCC family protein [Pseudonocardia acaciae]|uniref:SRPBCC family protein n=1 Tax=Pseudonocardia acaciae TaxID=551276 RepID=UPI000A47FE87|nr:SRPBCC family protein [Pseudonocardia acaciae]